MSREEEIYVGFSERWRNIPKPTIVAVQGKCIAGGLMLAWPCDLIIASDDASSADPTVRIVQQESDQSSGMRHYSCCRKSIFIAVPTTDFLDFFPAKKIVCSETRKSSLQLPATAFVWIWLLRAHGC